MATKVNPVTGALDYYEQALPPFRNKIHNGAMQIAQRATSTNFAHDGTTNGYVLDRFRIYTNNLQNWAGTVSQHTMSSSEHNTTGFTNALKFLTTNPESTIDNNEYVRIDTKLEGQDVKNLQYGTASAKSSTLSFWVNSSVTGTYGITFYSQCSQPRALNVTYTIDSANTWEHKTITIVGDTGEAHADDNTLGMMIVWSLASGSNYDSVNSTSWANYTTTNLNGGHQQDGVVTTDDAVFYLTGVQWEIGTSSTPFEHRPVGTELSLCQRYYQIVGPPLAMYMAEYGNLARGYTVFLVQMRAAPTLTFIGETFTYANSSETAAIYTNVSPRFAPQIKMNAEL